MAAAAATAGAAAGGCSPRGTSVGTQEGQWDHGGVWQGQPSTWCWEPGSVLGAPWGGGEGGGLLPSLPALPGALGYRGLTLWLSPCETLGAAPWARLPLVRRDVVSGRWRR